MQLQALLRFLSRTPEGQLILIQFIIFGLAAGWSLLTGILLSTTLMTIGAGIITFRFLGRVGPDRSSNSEHDNPDAPNTKALLKIPPMMIGLIPLIAGIFYAFIE